MSAPESGHENSEEHMTDVMRVGVLGAGGPGKAAARPLTDKRA